MATEEISAEAKIELLDQIYGLRSMAPRLLLRLGFCLLLGMAIGFFISANEDTWLLLRADPGEFFSHFFESLWPTLGYFAAIWFVLIAGGVVYRYYRLPQKAREVKYRADRNTISYEYGLGVSAKFPWSEVSDVKRTARLLLFKPRTSGAWFIMPRRALPEADQELLLEYARQAGVKVA